MELKETTISSEQLYHGKVVTLELDTVELPNGSRAKREVVRHPGGVTILALDEEDHVFFVRQFRYPYAKVLLELPAGKLERGEEPAACAMRELEEETGFTAERLSALGEIYPTPGCMDEVLHLYLARGLTRRQQNLDADEFLEVESIPLAQAVEYCLDGTLCDAKTVIALLKYDALRRRGRV